MAFADFYDLGNSFSVEATFNGGKCNYSKLKSLPVYWYLILNII